MIKSRIVVQGRDSRSPLNPENTYDSVFLSQAGDDSLLTSLTSAQSQHTPT
ncbi:hypothetical protein [Microcoleus anatoxicus]|uniref:hypothetical protein n=1 Tax=Microcoleus anatoxicus TaxID=2705319 RepID=UPI0030C8D4FC